MEINDVDSILDIDPMMPNYFWEALETSNKMKAAHMPLALILQAESDHNKIFSQLYSRNQILTLAETHRVAFKIIGNNNQIKEEILKIKEKEKRPIDLLMICGHGEEDSIDLGKNSEKDKTKAYSITDVRKEDFAGLNTTAKIVLMSCSTGALLGPHLAKVTKLNVIAPIIPCSYSALYFCPEHGIEVSEIEDEQQIFRVFHPDQEPSMPCVQIRSMDQSIDLIKKDAELGSLQSQWELAEHYLNDENEKSPELALYWVTKALEGGYAPLIRELKDVLDLEIAEKLLVKIADTENGDPDEVIDACETLASNYQWRPRCSEKAETYYKKAIALAKQAKKFEEYFYLQSDLNSLYRFWGMLDNLQCIPRYAEIFDQQNETEETLLIAAKNTDLDEEELFLVHYNLALLFRTWTDVNGNDLPRYKDAIFHYEQAMIYNPDDRDLIFEQLEELQMA